MCPIAFNSIGNTADIQTSNRVSKNNLPGVDKTNSQPVMPGETFTKSALLNSLESVVASDTMSATQAQKIAELKQKISNNELGILSNDADERLSAARHVAQKWLAFEQQLPIETTKRS